MKYCYCINMEPLDPKSYLWENICRLMKGKPSTIRSIHEKTRIGLGSVQRIKEGQTSVGTDNLLAIAKAFNVEVWELLKPPDTAPKEPPPPPMSLAATLQALSSALENVPAVHHDWRTDALEAFAKEPANWLRLVEKLKFLGLDMGAPVPAATSEEAPPAGSVSAPNGTPIATTKYGQYFAEAFATLGDSIAAEEVFHATHDAFQLLKHQHGFLDWPHHDRRETQRSISHDRRTPPPVVPKPKKVAQ